MANLTSLAAASSVVITVTEQQSIVLNNGKTDKARLQITTGPGAGAVVADNHTGRRVYGPFGAGTITLSAIVGACGYELSGDADSPLGDDFEFTASQADSLRSLVSKAGETGWAKLRSCAIAALVNNAEASAVTTLATQTAVAANPGTLTKQYTTLGSPTRFSFLGGNPSANTSSNRVLMPVSSVLPATNGNLNGTMLSAANDQQAWVAWIGVRTDSSKLSFAFSAFAGRNFRVIVDDGTGPKFINKTPAATFTTDGSKSWVEIDFSSVFAVRDIWIEFERNTGLYEVNVLPTSDVQPAIPRTQAVALVTGDSYGESQGASYVGQGWAPVAGRLLGWSDVRQVAVGSTGYLTNGSTRSILRDQIPRWLSINANLTAADVDVIVVSSGFNDRVGVLAATFTATQVGAEAAAAVQIIRQTWATTPIIVVGPWSAATGPSATVLAIEAAVQTAIAGLSDPSVLFVPCSTDVYPWTQGAGYVGATTGLGNSDRAITTDGLHPSDAGHTLIAQRFAGAVRQALGV